MKVNDFSSFGSNGNQKYITQLLPGEKFTAKIVDIKPDTVSLLLNDNSVLNARSLIVPDMRIGQDASFIVKENNSGQIILEMVKGKQSGVPENFVKEILNQAALPVTDENIDLIESLIKNNMPLDKGTLQKAVFFRYADSNPVIDKILFFIKENFSADKLNINTLNNILENKTLFKDYILDLIDSLTNLDDSNLKNELIKTFNIDSDLSKKEFNAVLKKKLFVSIDENSNYKDISKYFKNIENICNIASESAEINKNGEHLKGILKNISDTVNFMNHINSYKEYCQIPFNINDELNQCDLYIFKNKKGSKNSDTNISALISLDYPFLKHVEAFIEKNNKNINFQFRLDNDDIIKLFKKNYNKLNILLKQKGYFITNVSFIKFDEPFNITKDFKSNNQASENTGKRYSFDMRV